MKLMKRIIITIFLLAVASTSAAQTESKRIAEQIAPLINENVAFVVHVDLTKLDLDKLDAGLRPVLLESMNRIGMMSDDEDFQKERNASIDAGKTFAKGYLATMNVMYGVRDAYFVGTTALLPQSVGLAAIPVKSKEAADGVIAMLKLSPNIKTEYVNNLLLIIPDGLIRFSEELKPRVLNEFAPSKAVPRPELLTALETVEGTAVQVVVIPPKYFKRVIEETTDRLPKPLETFPVSTITRGFLWASLGLDCKKTELRLIVNSEHEQAAKDLRNLCEAALVPFLEWATMEQDDFRIFVNQWTPDTLRDILTDLLPTPQGNKLVFTLNEKILREKGSPLFDLPASVIEANMAAAKRMQCTNYIKQITLAMHNYHDANKQLPPAYTVDKDKKPLHSWRVLLLPYIEQMGLYEKIRLDEPWDSEWNKQFHNQCPPGYQCPQAASKDPNIKKNGLTTYSTIVGKDAYPDGGKRYEFSMITDGTSNTVAVVERSTPVCWMDPTSEITQEVAEKGINKEKDGIGSVHPGGVNAGLFDGSVRFISETIDLKQLKALITRSGGELMQW